MHLGTIIAGLSDEARVEEILASLDDLVLLARVRRAAAAAGEPLGSFASAAVGEFVEHADDETWQSLITAASKAADPATACLKRMLAFAIPVEDPAAGPAAPHHK